MIKPTQDFVLMEWVSGVRTTPQGIVIPDSAVHATPKGRVIDVGPGTALNTATGVTIAPVSVSIGEIVIFNPHGSYNVDENGKKLVMAREREILAVDSLEKR